MNMVRRNDLENTLQFQIEEEICDLFLLKEGEFEFLANAKLDETKALGGGYLRLKLSTNSLLLEAARRQDEWSTLLRRITSQSMLFRVKPETDEALKAGGGLSPEGLILITLIRNNRSIESMVQKGCLGRLTTNQLLVELWDAGLIEPREAGEYVGIAAEHLKYGRIDEAERIAKEAPNRGGLTPETKEELAKLLADISRRRSAARGAPSDSGSNRGEDVRVRSEVIRRHHPGLILKKDPARWPWVVGGIAVLAVAAFVGWHFFYRGGTDGNVEHHRDLNILMTDVEQLVNEGKYAESLLRLKGFRVPNPKVMQQAKDQLDRLRTRLQEMAFALTEEARKTMEAVRREKTEFAPDAADKLVEIRRRLERFLGIGAGDLSAPIAQAVNERVAECETLRQAVRLDLCRVKLEAIIGAEEQNGPLKTMAALRALLEEDAPESVARAACDHLAQKEAVEAEAQRLLDLALRLNECGGGEYARTLFLRVAKDFAGYAAAKRVAEEQQRLKVLEAEEEKKLALLEQLVLQNRSGEAGEGLRAFLATQPTEKTTDKARRLLHRVLPEAAAQAEQAARALELAAIANDNDQDKLTRLAVEFKEKHGHSLAAQTLELPVRIVSLPIRAALEVNGRQIGGTPITTHLPFLRAVLLGFKAEGRPPLEIVYSGWTGSELTVTIPPSPEWSKRLPFAGLDGMAAVQDRLAVAGAGRLALCDTTRQGAVLALHRLATEDEDKSNSPRHRPPGPVFSAAAAPHLFALTSASAFFAWRGDTGAPIFAAPLTTEAHVWCGPYPFLYEKRLFLGLITTRSFECFPADDQNQAVPARLALNENATLTAQPAKEAAGTADSAATVPKACGATEGQGVFYVAHADGKLHAIVGREAKLLWSVKLPEGAIGAPATVPAANMTTASVAVATDDGRLVIMDAVSGAERTIVKLESGCVVGPTVMTGGYVVGMKDSLAFVDAAQNSPRWTCKLGGDIALPLIVIPAADMEPPQLAVAETQALTLLDAATGKIVWSASLPAKPAAIAVFDGQIFVSLTNGDLKAYLAKQ
jgi:outer membrane protein assembly factor BamB